MACRIASASQNILSAMGADELNFHLRRNQNGEEQKSVSLQKTAGGKPRLTNLGFRSMRKVR
jgi:hypothetical protein